MTDWEYLQATEQHPKICYDQIFQTAIHHHRKRSYSRLFVSSWLF
jgi:hypothetical protein